jgi:hypothetical protein
MEIVDLTSAPTTSQRPQEPGPLIMTFSRDGQIIRNLHHPPPLLQHRPQLPERPYQIAAPERAIPTVNSSQIKYIDVEVVEIIASHPPEDSPGVRGTGRVQRPRQHHSPSFCTGKSSQIIFPCYEEEATIRGKSVVW